MLKETELWFKSLRQQNQPISNKKRKCWSLSRSLPELACDPADAARARQHSQESRLRRRTVQVQRRLESLVEQSRRQTALLLRRQQKTTAVQRFLRQPVAASTQIHGNEDYEWSTCGGGGGCGGSAADRRGCCAAGEQICAERPGWWQSDPDLRREPCCPTPARHLPCCDPRAPQQTAAQTRCPPQPVHPEELCPQQIASQYQHPSQETAPHNQQPPQETARQKCCTKLLTLSQSNCSQQTTEPQDHCLQQTALQSQHPQQQTEPEDHCPQQTTLQNQHPPKQAEPQDYCPQLQTSSQSHCHPQQTQSQNQQTPQPPQPDRGNIRRSTRVTFDPSVIRSSNANGAVSRCEPSSTNNAPSVAWRRSDVGASVQSPEDRGTSRSAGILKTSIADSGPVPGRPSVADNVLTQKTDVSPTSESRTHHDISDISSEAFPVPRDPNSHVTSCRVGSLSPPSRVATEGSAPDRQSRCPDPSDVGQLAVVGRHCQLSPRGLTQNKAAGHSISDQAAAFPEPRLASVATNTSFPVTQPFSSHLAKLGAVKPVYQGAGRSRFELHEDRGASSEESSSQDLLALCKEPETNRADQMDAISCKDSALDMATSKHKENETKANAMSSPEDKRGENSLAMNINGHERSHQVDNYTSTHDVQSADLERQQTVGKSSNASERDERAFFIDITTGQSCTIQSMSEESTSFRGNRTLLLRQLLSQQKIDEAEHKRKASSPRPTRRRAASQARARNAEMITDILLHQSTSEGQHPLPILKDTGQNTRPYVLQRPEYLDMIGNLRSLRAQNHGDDFHHRDGFPQMRLRCGSAATHHHFGHTTDNRSRGVVTPNLADIHATAGITAASQSIRTRAKPQLASCIDNSAHHCSHHHQCGHTEHDNSQRHTRSPTENREAADHAHTVAHHCHLSLSASQQSERGQRTSRGYNVSSGQDLYAGSIAPSKNASSTPPLAPTSDAAPELQLSQFTSSKLQESSERKQAKTNSANSSGVVTEVESAPYHTTDNLPSCQTSRMNPNPDILPSCNPTEPKLSEIMRSLHDGPPVNVSNAYSPEGRATDPTVKPAREFVSSLETGSACIAAEWLDDPVGHQNRSATAVTLRTATSPSLPAAQTGAVPRTAAMTTTTLPAATGVSTPSDWREDPVHLRSAADQSRKARAALAGRTQRAPPASLAAAEAKNWTSVMLVSPQNMEMSFSLRTHLPSIGDQHRQQQQRQQPGQKATGRNTEQSP